MHGMSTNQEILDELRREHEDLKELLDTCDQVADEVEDSGQGGRALIEAVTRLLEAFASHNRAEEMALRPILLEADSFGEVRVAQMMEDHLAEHAAIVSVLRDIVLVDDLALAARALRACTDRIRQYMETEERQYLNDKVVRDDLVAIDFSDG